jgi:hypothetical protein
MSFHDSQLLQNTQRIKRPAMIVERRKDLASRKTTAVLLYKYLLPPMST